MDTSVLGRADQTSASPPADSELCQAIAVLARAHQDAIWRRTTAHHQLRSLLREFYPPFLSVFTGRSRWVSPAPRPAPCWRSPPPRPQPPHCR